MNNALWFLLGLVLGLLLAFAIGWFLWARGAREREESLKADLAKARAEVERLTALLGEKGIATGRAAPAAVAPDDLELIEGIGPKVSRLLREHGITTFAQLATTNVGHLERILREANLPMMDPRTWPEQARLAAEGKWDALKALQEELKGGRRV